MSLEEDFDLSGAGLVEFDGEDLCSAGGFGHVPVGEKGGGDVGGEVTVGECEGDGGPGGAAERESDPTGDDLLSQADAGAVLGCGGGLRFTAVDCDGRCGGSGDVAVGGVSRGGPVGGSVRHDGGGELVEVCLCEACCGIDAEREVVGREEGDAAGFVGGVLRYDLREFEGEGVVRDGRGAIEVEDNAGLAAVLDCAAEEDPERSGLAVLVEFPTTDIGAGDLLDVESDGEGEGDVVQDALADAVLEPGADVESGVVDAEGGGGLDFDDVGDVAAHGAGLPGEGDVATSCRWGIRRLMRRPVD